jgi:hypothetical protein
MMTTRNNDARETDSVDLFTAFAIGAMIGVGATLLLRPDPPTTTERVLKRFGPLAKRARKAARKAGRDVRRGVDLSRAAGRDLGVAGKDVLDDFREQVEEILSSARDELTDSARRQLRSARKTLGRKLHG